MADDKEGVGVPDAGSSDERFREAMRKNAEAIKEAHSVLEDVQLKLAEAATSLARYGDAPFSDLERKK